MYFSKPYTINLPTTIKILQAFHGDSILILTEDANGFPYNILIDGGPSRAFDYTLKTELKQISTIHLLILTHIDSDHIGGLIKLFKNSFFEKIQVGTIWMNGRNLLKIASGDNISYTQGITFEELLINVGLVKEKFNHSIVAGVEPLQLAPEIKVTILSPTQTIIDALYMKWPELYNSDIATSDDVNIGAYTPSINIKVSLEELAKFPFSPPDALTTDIFNSSSIAMLMVIGSIKVLMLGDSRPEIIIESLKHMGYDTLKNRLKIDLLKISHHGSKNNTSTEFLDYLECNNFVISTNGGSSKHKHPDRETIARIVYHPNRDFRVTTNIYLNYPYEELVRRKGPFLMEEDFKKGNWKLIEKSNFIY